MDIACALLALFPVIWFLTIVMTDLGALVSGKKLDRSVAAFFLRASGWNQKGQFENTPTIIRIGTGILFFLLYGYFILSPFAWIFKIQPLDLIAVFVASLMLSLLLFFIFIGSFYCCAACVDGGAIIIPWKFWHSVKLSAEEVSELQIKKIGFICILHSSLWRKGKFILLSKNQLDGIIKGEVSKTT